MLSGITATCFVSCYVVALALAAVRPLTQNRLRRPAMIGFAAAGLFAHSLYLGARAGNASASPLSTPYDWYLLAAWVIVAIYFYLEFYYPKAAVAVFVMPIVLAMIGAAHFADQQPFAQDRASRLWGNVHGTSLLIGTVTVIVGFIAGLMYLVQSYRLKHKMIHSDGFRLPSLERLEKINARSIVTSVLFIGIGFVSGIELAMLKGGRSAQSIPWSDPVVAGLALMLGWLIVAQRLQLVLSRGAPRTQSRVSDRGLVYLPDDHHRSHALHPSATRIGTRGNPCDVERRGRAIMRIQVVGCSHHGVVGSSARTACV